MYLVSRAFGGDDGIRTHDPLLAGQVLSQLSYTPILFWGFILSVRPFISQVLFSSHRRVTISPSVNFPEIWEPTLSVGHSKLNNKRVIPRTCTLLDLSSVVILLYLRLRNLANSVRRSHVLHRKEVIQPHLPIRLPCYDLTPIIEPTFDCCLLAVSTQASGVPNFHGLTGGVYKARERIHRDMLIRDY